MSRRTHQSHSHSHSGRSRTPGDRQSRAEQSLSTTQASLDNFHIGDPVLYPYEEPIPPLPSTSSRHRPDQYPASSVPLQDYSFDPYDLNTGTVDPNSTMSTAGYYQHSYPVHTPYSGYSDPSSGLPPSRSMSGPPSHVLPSSILPSSTFEEEFTEAGRDVARQRHRRIAHSRRQHKARVRRTMLPGDPGDSGSSQVDEYSGSINAFVAPSSSGRSSSYTTSGSVGGSNYATTSGSYSSGGYPSYSTQSYHNEPLYPQSSYPHDSARHPRSPAPGQNPNPVIIEQPKKPQCWDHGCNGRSFSTFSNLLRHQREKSGTSSKSVCPRCGAEFTRKTARDGHMAHDKCKGRSSRD